MLTPDGGSKKMIIMVLILSLNCWDFEICDLFKSSYVYSDTIIVTSDKKPFY